MCELDLMLRRRAARRSYYSILPSAAKGRRHFESVRQVRRCPMVLSMARRRRANVFSVDGSAPAGATENSQGRKPLVFAKTDRQPCKGGRRLLSPFQGSAPLYRRFQGLAPLANNFRRSAALRIASHRFAARLVFKLRTMGHSLTCGTARIGHAERRAESSRAAGLSVAVRTNGPAIRNSRPTAGYLQAMVA